MGDKGMPTDMMAPMIREGEMGDKPPFWFAAFDAMNAKRLLCSFYKKYVEVPCSAIRI